ncbi:hypothetical protein HPP92_012564 [Vanilla planifolia]|uniref:cellulase n=1 Tax=Vanilla planifolia TaxID=51239 RepID=A0A835V3G3_VANPL|nr:hypothetical protein HPP92_012564 [Vanilla planifolia]
MSMYGRDPWGGPLEISHADSATDDDRSRNLDLDRAALSTSSRQLDETQQSWLLAGPGDQGKKKKYVDLGCLIISRKLFIWILGAVLGVATLAGILGRFRSTTMCHGGKPGMKDGLSDSAFRRSLVGGYYDAGDAIKFNFPASFAMTMLSWSVIEYSAKYQAIGELAHVRQIIKWGSDYLLKTFNSSADTIDRIAAQVGVGDTNGGPTPNDHYCWMRPEDIDYPRPVYECHTCSDLAAEMAASARGGVYSLQGQQVLLAEAGTWGFDPVEVCKEPEREV